MPRDQGSTELLKSEVAQRLLASTIYARLAYTWLDGSPRVVPIWFHWTGEEMVFASAAGAPKVRALKVHPAAAVTIDAEGYPCDVLMLRGPMEVTDVDTVVPEYAMAAKRYMGDEAGTEFASQFEGRPMARMAMRPTWAATLDFQTRFPSALEG